MALPGGGQPVLQGLPLPDGGLKGGFHVPAGRVGRRDAPSSLLPGRPGGGQGFPGGGQPFLRLAPPCFRLVQRPAGFLQPGGQRRQPFGLPLSRLLPGGQRRQPLLLLPQSGGRLLPGGEARRLPPFLQGLPVAFAQGAGLGLLPVGQGRCLPRPLALPPGGFHRRLVRCLPRQGGG